ncbi:MAG: hypothetical protein ACLFV6_10125 [Spirulinaceae cyanobacterium]
MFAQQPRFQGYLQAALQALQDSGNLLEITENSCHLGAISASRIRNNTVMGYRSAIALQLSGKHSEAVLEIAQSLVKMAMQQQSEWEFQVIGGGWIEGKLCDRAFVDWLQYSLEDEPVADALPNREIPLTAELFPIQYAHARCCSLLQMAHRSRIIELVNPDAAPPWHWRKPQRVFENASICLQHPVEWALLGQIWDVLDGVAIAPETAQLKSARRLSEAWLQFERSCRIWGEVQRNQPQLAQMRLGLVAIAQKLLWRLLREHLNAIPMCQF